MKANLSPRQQRFVDEYLIDLNATQSAIRAGYSKNSARPIGHENLSKPGIAAAVTNAKRERSDATKIDAEWVLKQAVEVHRRCMSEIRLVRNPKTGKQLYDADGNSLFKFNAAAANRALEIIGKHTEIGCFKERIEHSSGLSVIERLQQGRERARQRNAKDDEGKEE